MAQQAFANFNKHPQLKNPQTNDIFMRPQSQKLENTAEFQQNNLKEDLSDKENNNQRF